MKKTHVIEKLMKIANILDQKGLHREASYIDHMFVVKNAGSQKLSDALSGGDAGAVMRAMSDIASEAVQEGVKAYDKIGISESDFQALMGAVFSGDIDKARGIYGDGGTGGLPDSDYVSSLEHFLNPQRPAKPPAMPKKQKPVGKGRRKLNPLLVPTPAEGKPDSKPKDKPKSKPSKTEEKPKRRVIMDGAKPRKKENKSGPQPYIQTHSSATGKELRNHYVIFPEGWGESGYPGDVWYRINQMGFSEETLKFTSDEKLREMFNEGIEAEKDKRRKLEQRRKMNKWLKENS